LGKRQGKGKDFTTKVGREVGGQRRERKQELVPLLSWALYEKKIDGAAGERGEIKEAQRPPDNWKQEKEGKSKEGGWGGRILPILPLKES